MWQDEQSSGCQTYRFKNTDLLVTSIMFAHFCRFERRASQDCVGYQPPGGGYWYKCWFLVLLIDFSFLLWHLSLQQRQYLETHMSTHLTTCPTPSMGWVSIFYFYFWVWISLLWLFENGWLCDQVNMFLFERTLQKWNLTSKEGLNRWVCSAHCVHIFKTFLQVNTD